MTLEELKALAKVAKAESAENLRRHRSGEPTSIAAYLRYVGALHELVGEIEYEDDNEASQ